MNREQFRNLFHSYFASAIMPYGAIDRLPELLATHTTLVRHLTAAGSAPEDRTIALLQASEVELRTRIMEAQPTSAFEACLKLEHTAALLMAGLVLERREVEMVLRSVATFE